MKIHDTVRLKSDIPEHNLRAGMLGVVVAAFYQPEVAYEIEFANDRGETIVELALRPELLEHVS
jgi:hypothetical protein